LKLTTVSFHEPKFKARFDGGYFTTFITILRIWLAHIVPTYWDQENTNIVKCYVACGTRGVWLLRKGNTEKKQTLRQHISNYCNKCVTRLAKNLKFCISPKNLKTWTILKKQSWIAICTYASKTM